MNRVRKELGETRPERGLSEEKLGRRAHLSGKFIGEVKRDANSISIDSLARHRLRPRGAPARVGAVGVMLALGRRPQRDRRRLVLLNPEGRSEMTSAEVRPPGGHRRSRRRRVE